MDLSPPADPLSDPDPGTPEDGVDWSLGSWEGSRRQQHQRFQALTFREKMEALERWCDLSRRLLKNHPRAGRPYRDPLTGRVVRPAPDDGAPAGAG